MIFHCEILDEGILEVAALILGWNRVFCSSSSVILDQEYLLIISNIASWLNTPIVIRLHVWDLVILLCKVKRGIALPHLVG